jgi:hypothetical protein
MKRVFKVIENGGEVEREVVIDKGRREEVGEELDLTRKGQLMEERSQAAGEFDEVALLLLPLQTVDVVLFHLRAQYLLYPLDICSFCRGLGDILQQNQIRLAFQHPILHLLHFPSFPPSTSPTSSDKER